MGRKIEMKKIQDSIKSQVTFSKRRASLIKRAYEISVICDVDVAFLAFSPAGRISKFCNRERMVDLLDVYANLPTEKRLSHLKNVQEKMAKLQELDTVGTDDGKLQYLNDRIENLKLQLEKNQMEVQLAEANLGDFELNPAQQASLHQLSWCEKNLKNCIEKIKQIKKEKMLEENEGAVPCLYSKNGSRQQFQQQSDSWKNKEFKYPENIFNQMLGKGKGKGVADNNGVSIPTSYALNYHQFVVPETQTWLPNASLQRNVYKDMRQPRNTMPTNTYTPQQQVSINPVYPHQYSEKCASNKEHQLWMEALIPQQQAESLNSSFAGEKNSNCFMKNNFSSYPSGLPSSTLVDTCFDIPMRENQSAAANQVFDQMEMEKGNEGNGDGYETMIVPSQSSPSTSGIPSYLYDLLLSEDPLAEVSTAQNIEDDDQVWDWDN